MASAVFSSKIPSSDIVSVSRPSWISSEEQMARFPLSKLPFAKTVCDIYFTKSDKSAYPIDLAKIVYRYALPENALTNWYKALKILNLPEQEIPPLPGDIDEMLASKCPIYRNQLKEDGTPYTTQDTHVLALISKEYGHLKAFIRDILMPFGKREYGETVEMPWGWSEDYARSPLRFRNIQDQVLSDSQFLASDRNVLLSLPDTHWILMTKDILPDSRDKSWREQEDLVQALAERTSLEYRIPTLRQSFVAMMTHMVATKEKLFPVGQPENRYTGTYMRVWDSNMGNRWSVGGFSHAGVKMQCYESKYHNKSIGVAACRVLN